MAAAFDPQESRRQFYFVDEIAEEFAGEVGVTPALGPVHQVALSGEQRIWRNMTRMKMQLTGDRVRLQNQMECLLEEMRIKLSSVVSDLLGTSGLRILRALAQGETDS
jgi:hypothetical protein